MRRIDYKHIIQYCGWNEGDEYDNLKINGTWCSPYSIRILIDNVNATNATGSHGFGSYWWFFE